MSSPTPDTVALIAAAGKGRRFGCGASKIVADLAGLPLVVHSLRAFEECPSVGAVVPIAAPGQERELRRLADRYACGKVTHVATGAAHRQDSIYAGLKSLDPTVSLVAIHDGARPLVTPELICRTIRAARDGGAAIAAAPVADTIKRGSADGTVAETLDRRELHRVQTPQTFRYDLILAAHERARRDGFRATDDAALVERLGHEVAIVASTESNLKVTTREDLAMAEALVGGQGTARIGHGHDLHRLVEGRPLILGGVAIPFEKGLLGHSDGDALLHASCDAVLGAAGAGDIGRHFPDTDPTYEGASSLDLARQVAQTIAERGLTLGNLDATVLCQAPRLAPHVDSMRANIADAFGVPPEQISVKATTTEGLGPVGRGEAIECHAVALLRASRR
ncbi:MAG: 2-C-methyl-D-erythritol 4-phosphate cytidylyltransferase [Armatimonadota bacterium]